MEAIKLDSGKRAFEVEINGLSTKWEYDVVTVKLAMEALESKHGLRNGEKVAPPTTEFLTDAISALTDLGLIGCTVDAAYKIYHVVNAQFAKLSSGVASQVASIVAE